MTRTHLSRTVAAALLAVIGASSALAHSMAEGSTADHNRFLRGDTQATAPQAATRLVPGPNARHLIFLGIDPAQAIEQARIGGEQARVEAVIKPAAGMALTGHDLYDRIVLR